MFYQHLLRQGREAVVVAHELDVVSTEYSEESPMQATDMVSALIIYYFYCYDFPCNHAVYVPLSLGMPEYKSTSFPGSSPTPGDE